MSCPKCKEENNQNKDGFTKAKSQRYRCKKCRARYIPHRKPQGYDLEIRNSAIRMYSDGLSYRQIGRQLGVNHSSAMNWVRIHANKLPEASVPKEVDTVEMDELFTFIEEKKTGSRS